MMEPLGMEYSSQPSYHKCHLFCEGWWVEGSEEEECCFLGKCWCFLGVSGGNWEEHKSNVHGSPWLEIICTSPGDKCIEL